MDEEYETGYTQSPFSCFLQTNDDEEFESIDSLCNFMKGHSSDKSNKSQPSNLLDNPDACNDLTSFVSKSLNPTNVISENSRTGSKTDEFDECNTLEEYTKSFLNSKGNCSIPNRFRIQSENSNGDSKTSNSDLASVNEKLSKFHFTNSNQADSTSDTWNIDLSVALQNSKIKKTGFDKKCELNEPKLKPQVYLSHVHVCNLDISYLASEKLSYNNSILSSFGYVLNRKWPKLPLPKKLKKIGRNWPYNKSKSFKFDSPSPDDIILKKKAKLRTNSFNDV